MKRYLEFTSLLLGISLLLSAYYSSVQSDKVVLLLNSKMKTINNNINNQRNLSDSKKVFKSFTNNKESIKRNDYENEYKNASISSNYINIASFMFYISLFLLGIKCRKLILFYTLTIVGIISLGYAIFVSA